jgi:hypothetical protein
MLHQDLSFKVVRRQNSLDENPSKPIESRQRDKEKSSESAKEFHYAGIVSPPFLDSAAASSWLTGGESLSFHGQVCFRIDVGGVKRNVAQPCPDCVEVNASAEQVGCGCMTDRMRAYPFGF